VEGGFLVDVVVLEGAAVLELLAGEDEALLSRWMVDSFRRLASSTFLFSSSIRFFSASAFFF